MNIKIIRIATAAAMVLAMSNIALAQSTNPLSLSVSPAVALPLGPELEEGIDTYSIGASGRLGGNYQFPFAPWFYGLGIIDYTFLSTTVQTSLSLVSAGAGAGVRLTPLPAFDLKIFGAGGYGAGFYQGDEGTSTGGVPFATAGIDASISLSPSFSIGLGASFNYHVLYYGIGASLTASFNLGSGSSRSRLEIPDVQLEPIFPVFYAYYDRNPLGFVIIKNAENGPIHNVKVSIFAEELMSQPKMSAEIPELKKDEERRVPIYALFTDDILSITDNTVVAGKLTVEYEYLDTPLTATRSDSLRVYHRNAMTWDDDKKAASFVTPRDPQILKMAKQIASEVRNLGNSVVDLNLRESIGIFQAMKSHGLKYVIDPASAYAELSQDKFALDYLQFPAQTFTYRSGDCDDLSICYAALLESVGIETAFVTVPGHIFMAFAVDAAVDSITKTFLRPDDFIIRDGKAWVPVETTAVQEGFLEAWKLGARQWRENDAAGTAGFTPIRNAWNTFEAAGADDEDFVVAETDIDEVISFYKNEFNRFVDREVFERTQALHEQAEASNSPGRIVNKIGVLYARYGLYSKAALEFREAANDGYAPAMVNLGNIFYIQDNIMMAIEYYEKARESEPDSVPVLTGLAKAYHELEENEMVQQLYDRIVELSLDAAESLAYLDARSDTGSRAADTSERKYSTIVWDEEE